VDDTSKKKKTLIYSYMTMFSIRSNGCPIVAEIIGYTNPFTGALLILLATNLSGFVVGRKNGAL
jgi:hypothetical protein